MNFAAAPSRIPTDRLIRQISARMSLRKPQERSLEILHSVGGALRSAKDLTEALAAIQELADRDVQRVEAFERNFVSLCFAIATGVGKTRLMGAFITYLALTGHSKHFFVLAPNTTIYEKLIDDFTPGKPKYVFKGIAEFAQSPPQLVTGDNWDQGRGLRRQGELIDADVIINVFNVDKINKDVGRIRKLHEYIGESYYDYLAALPDLVLLMDEAHRYRAKAGFKAIADLKPMLGIELTATPKTVGAKSVDFKNVIYRYGLAEAMEDGFVKEPAVATRKNFDPRGFNDDELEKIKLEDGVQAHENVKLKLIDYAQRTGDKLVHPFILVVAQDTTHAEAIRKRIESDQFFAGRYKGRVIRVDSALRGEESDEATSRLLALEQDGATEIVIHVNKLKEGWDVTNLYTIVPLRASASEILTEQTLGRGLRLPYGVRTGDEAIDTLTVIAHDRFDEIIKRAKEPGSILLKSVEIDTEGNVWRDGAVELVSPSIVESMITGLGGASHGELGEQPQVPYVFDTPEAQSYATVTYKVIRQMERELPNLAQLQTQQVQSKITERVQELMRPVQGTLEGILAKPDAAKIVEAVTHIVVNNTIEIPQIVVLPTSDVTFSLNDFDLSDLDTVAPQPLSDEIVVQQMRTGERLTIARNMAVIREERLEDYLVVHLIDFEQVDYDANADLLYKLAGQIVARLRSYLPDDAAVENVLVHQGKRLAQIIFGQMMKHYVETPTRYQARVYRGFQILERQTFKVAHPKGVRDFRMPVTPASETRRHVFGGFKKCAYPEQSFQSDEERLFAVLIDADREPDVLRWVKPGRKQFQIEYRRTERYEPDFVVETTSEKLIVEIKARKDLEDETVKAKAIAARIWIGHATAHAASYGGKPWRYLLVPHDAVLENMSLEGLAAHHELPAIIQREEELAPTG
ncbi:DEAD/DEAH box helicase family protein [Blastochloris sulfoviridis]|uniref:Restriction endonuclease subunit R n=1 Tax=Blastochloris sulfoviridis TaxID=50712 RepID=A0A5M6HGV9_9HYPH|nr:DEAD/DEAH box helicase family protein [Blastochloris sulfoviridis]KAA5595087.1 restriction endonuclease subunit R [Blastochloris sulfoviridis]